VPRQFREKIVFVRDEMMTTATITTAIHSAIDEETAWQQLTARDRKADFLYGVTTTGVFCKPGCGSRAPLRSNTRFFATAQQARAEGFRPCQRCKPEDASVLGKPEAVARMCARLESQIDRPVRLTELGKLAKMSPFTAQKLFKQTMGVTPAQYQRAIRANALRTGLRTGETNVTNAIYDAGYGSSSRAYEQAPLAMTPGKFLAGGRGEKIRFAVSEVKDLGWIIIGATARGICWLAIGSSAADAEASIREEFPAAEITQDPELATTLQKIVAGLGHSSKSGELPLDLRGTAFQLRVWQALQQIPAGLTKTYSQLAAEMGIPSSTRAVARACAVNRVSVLVPCHRVVGVSGSLTGYRWGIERKRQLLAVEHGRTR
jgi:AraC family transcriptional regulator, regulatory protein of adaptative response / methylated-DNA-[protein]-cysteine methyltransferase